MTRTLMHNADRIFKILRTTDGWIEHNDMVRRASLRPPLRSDERWHIVAVNRAVEQLKRAGHLVERREEPGGTFYRLVVER